MDGFQSKGRKWASFCQKEALNPVLFFESRTSNIAIHHHSFRVVGFGMDGD